MNDDPSTSTSDESPNALAAPETGDSDPALSRREERRAKRRMRHKKRSEFLDDILRNFDILIYCELSVVYYLDCSSFRFLLRALVQFFYLTPKPPIFPEAPRNRPYVGAILGANIFCLILHIILARPEAGEAVRGYLHGGLLIDFIGQQGPTSKIRLVLLDLLTATLQLLMLSTFIEQQQLKDSSATTTSTASTTPGPALDTGGTSPAQDQDSEERGVLRSDATADDIELQPLGAARSHTQSEGRTGGDEDGERDELLAEPDEDSGGGPRDDPLDMYSSGEAVVAELHLLDTIRNPRWIFENQTTSSVAASTGSSATMATNFARSGFGIRVRVGGRDVGAF